MNIDKEFEGYYLPKILQHISVVVRTSVREALQHFDKERTSKSFNIDEDFLSAEQAASFLKIKLNTIYSKVKKGELPYSRSGKRKLLFSKKDLEQYFANRKVKSNDETKE